MNFDIHDAAGIANTVAAPANADQALPAAETKYNLQNLCEHALELFGVGCEVIVGALHKEQPREAWSITEIKERIEAFLKQEVK